MGNDWCRNIFLSEQKLNVCRVEYVLDALIGRSREENEVTGSPSAVTCLNCDEY